MQARKEARRVVSEYRATFHIIHRRALQYVLFGSDGQIPAQVRKVSSIQNVIDARYVSQHIEHRIAPSKSRIPIHPAEHVGSGASLLGACDETHLVDDRETGGGVGD